MSQSPGEPASPARPTPIVPERQRKNWFISDGRLRSGWRVSLYVIVARLVDLAGALAIGVIIALIVGAPLARSGVAPAEIAQRIAALFSNLFEHPLLALGLEGERLILILAVVWFFRHVIDRRSVRTLGVRFDDGWWREFASGFAFSFFGWSVLLGASLALGATTIVGFGWDVKDWVGVLGGLALGLLFNILVGFTEELDARGYVLQNLAEGIRLGPAILVSSLYFGLLHLLNPGAGLTSTLGIFFAGILLALGYYATGRLWFSIGLHAAWNFAEGPVFGFLVSGLNMGGLLRLSITGPDWLMGGAFGPEAGVLAILVEIAMIAVLWSWGRRRVAAAPRAARAES